MSGSLDGKVIVVTGAGSGIGRGILRQSVAAGARVWGLDVADGAAEAIEAEGGVARHADVTDVHALAEAIGQARASEGRLDGLVSNAGLTLTAPFLEADVAMWDRLWRTNQRSVLAGCQAAARIMAADGHGGSLVNISSNHGRSSDQGYEAYAGTKGAIIAMTRAMAWSLGPMGIRVNALCPGLTMTEAVTRVAEEGGHTEMFKRWHATGSVATVDQMGQAAVFLLSPASAAMTGTEIIADQGMTARLVDLGS